MLSSFLSLSFHLHFSKIHLNILSPIYLQPQDRERSQGAHTPAKGCCLDWEDSDTHFLTSGGRTWVASLGALLPALHLLGGEKELQTLA